MITQKVSNWFNRVFNTLINKKHLEDIQETLFLSSNKDNRETIISALKQPIEDGTEINWKSV